MQVELDPLFSALMNTVSLAPRHPKTRLDNLSKLLAVTSAGIRLKLAQVVIIWSYVVSRLIVYFSLSSTQTKSSGTDITL